MANHTLAADEVGLYDASPLVAATVDTITIGQVVSLIEVETDASAVVYVTTDGSDPVASNRKAWRIPAISTGGAAIRRIRIPKIAWTAGATPRTTTTVKLKSAGTPAYYLTVLA